MHITVAIPTKERPVFLELLLSALARQSLPPSISMSIQVVDNDSRGSAHAVVERLRHVTGMAVEYALEPTPGIAAARNRALALARGDALAFIDDDETPCETWLADLAATLHRHTVELVFAPVLPLYDDSTPAWIKSARVFERRRLGTGQPVAAEDMRTGNVLISLPWLRSQQPPLTFDSRLGLTGGEDTKFFGDARRRGARGCWCDTAVVTEHVPAHRSTLRYLLRRWFQIGISSCMIAGLTEGAGGRLREGIKGVVLIPIGAVLGLVALPSGADRTAKWFMKSVMGAGKIAGALGFRLHTYAQPAART